jgi:hypothetical protein
MKTKIELENVENNLFISDLLASISEILNSKGETVEVKKENIPGTKGVIVTALIVGVASNLLTDIIKLAINNIISHKKYDPKSKIKIDKSTFEIGDLVLNK